MRDSNLKWYNGQKNKVFDNKLGLEMYCHVDVTILREAFQIFAREFMEFGNIEVFSSLSPLHPTKTIFET